MNLDFIQQIRAIDYIAWRFFVDDIGLIDALMNYDLSL